MDFAKEFGLRMQRAGKRTTATLPGMAALTPQRSRPLIAADSDAMIIQTALNTQAIRRLTEVQAAAHHISLPPGPEEVPDEKKGGANEDDDYMDDDDDYDIA